MDFSTRFFNALFYKNSYYECYILVYTGCGSSAPWTCKKYGLRCPWQTQKRNFEKIKQSSRSGDLIHSSDKCSYFVKTLFKRAFFALKWAWDFSLARGSGACSEKDNYSHLPSQEVSRPNPMLAGTLAKDTKKPSSTSPLNSLSILVSTILIISCSICSEWSCQ